MFHIIRTADENGSFQWTVQRLDGKSFHDGILGVNFNYTEEGGFAAITYAKKMENEFLKGQIK
jgi:hypothetical protein